LQFLLVIALVFSFLVPAGVVFAEQEQPVQEQPIQEQPVQTPPGGDVAGINPVSVDQIGDRIQEAGDKLYLWGSPVLDMLGKLSFAAAAVLLVLALVLGAGMLQKVIGICFTVALGIGLWYSAPWLVELIKSVSIWFTS